MAQKPRDTAISSQLSSEWWRIPIYDPGPPWWFETVSEEMQHELVLEQINATKELMQVHMKSLDRQAQILARKR